MPLLGLFLAFSHFHHVRKLPAPQNETPDSLNFFESSQLPTHGHHSHDAQKNSAKLKIAVTVTTSERTFGFSEITPSF